METNYYIYIGLYLIYTISFWKMFEKAGLSQWQSLVPVYNLLGWLKIIKKPWWWVFFWIFPGVNVLMFIVMNVITAHRFNKYSFTDTLTVIFLPFLYIPYLAFNDLQLSTGADWSNEKDRKKRRWGDELILLLISFGIGHIFIFLLRLFGFKNKPKVPTMTLEWSDAIVFAIVAASIIRTYTFEAFTIPTSSMEKTLLKGDFLFVSKLHYGPKIPMTPLSFPFAHHTLPDAIGPMPLVFPKNTKSYLEWMKLPYYRLPGFADIKRNDIVVFNFPEGDTVFVDEQNRSYYEIVREYAHALKSQDEQQLNTLKSSGKYMHLARKQLLRKRPWTVRPVDKKENYIKRCVAAPGDKLEIVNGKLLINDETAFIPPGFQFKFWVFTSDKLNPSIMKKKYDINPEDLNYIPQINGYNITMTMETYKQFEQLPIVNKIIPQFGLFQSNDNMQRIFPNDKKYKEWAQDNFGSITIPKKGKTVKLTAQNLPVYWRMISIYEHNELELKNGKIFINQQETDSYTFKMNYYWLMGDSRHNSQDSRYWGFVPEDHVVGKAVFIWLSLDPDLGWFDGKIRWNRLFSTIHD